MKMLLILVLFIVSLQAELVRVVSNGENIITSIKVDLYSNFPNKIYFILYQEFDTENRIGIINKYYLGYQFKF